MRTRWMVGGPREIPRADNAPTSKTKGKEEGLGGHGMAAQPQCPTNVRVRGRTICAHNLACLTGFFYIFGTEEYRN